MQLHGDWRAALSSRGWHASGSSFGRAAPTLGRRHTGSGELLRLQGELAEAERPTMTRAGSGRTAAGPGLATPRSGKDGRRVRRDRTDRRRNDRVGGAREAPAGQVEITLAVGMKRARGCLHRARGTRRTRRSSELLGARAAQARGAVELAGDDARGAVVMLRQAARLSAGARSALRGAPASVSSSRKPAVRWATTRPSRWNWRPPAPPLSSWARCRT